MTGQRDVIFTVAAGDSKYRQMASLLTSSLKTRFAGQVMVFADGPVEGVQELPIPPKPEDSVYIARISTGKFIADTCDVDRILYLDSDILAIRNVDPLFECFTQEGFFGFNEATDKVNSHGLYYTYMSSEEKDKFGHLPAVNSGIIGGTRDSWLKYCPVWINEFTSKPYHHPMSDQTSLNALYVRGQIPIHFMDPAWLGCPYNRRKGHSSGPNTILEHFNPFAQVKQMQDRLDLVNRS